MAKQPARPDTIWTPFTSRPTFYVVGSFHFQKGNQNSFYYAICLALNDLENTLGKIRKELGTAILYNKLSWDGATYASITFGAYLDDLRKQLLHLQDHAD